MFLADIPSQLTANDLGNWILGLGGAVGIIGGVLFVINQTRKLLDSKPAFAEQYVTNAQLDAFAKRIDNCVTKSEFHELKDEVGAFRRSVDEHNRQDASSFEEIKVEIARLATLIEERIPPTATIVRRGRLRRDET